MSSYTSFYRLANPEYYQMEKKKINEAQKLRYKMTLYIKKDKSNMQNYKDRKKLLRIN